MLTFATKKLSHAYLIDALLELTYGPARLRGDSDRSPAAAENPGRPSPSESLVFTASKWLDFDVQLEPVRGFASVSRPRLTRTWSHTRLHALL